LAKLPISGFLNPNLIVFSASKLQIHLTIQCLFYLFLLVLRLLAGRVPSWLGCRTPQDHIDHGSWCIGRLGTVPLDGCSRVVNVDSLAQLSYHSSPPKDRGFNPHKSPSASNFPNYANTFSSRITTLVFSTLPITAASAPITRL
jgi:hypothetical protein